MKGSNKKPEGKNKKSSNKHNREKKILFIGDLFIDENWLMGRAHNNSSTDVGDAHFQSLTDKIDGYVWSVCGIANVVKIFLGKVEDKSILHVAGIWNLGDEKLIKEIICRKIGDGNQGNNPEKAANNFYTPYTLIKNESGDIDKDIDRRLQMINLMKEPDKAATNRIYRIYEGHYNSSPKLRCRYDWQGNIAKADIDVSKLGSDIDVKNKRNGYDAIIIVDHGKGTIQPKVAEELIKVAGKGCKWYLRAKTNKQRWMRKLIDKKINLRLLAIDEQLVTSMYSPRDWVRDNEICRASLDLIGELMSSSKDKDSKGPKPLPRYKDGNELTTYANNFITTKRTAILFDDNSVLAASLYNEKEKEKEISNANVYYYKPKTDNKWAVRVGRTSTFFSTLVHLDLNKPVNKISDEELFRRSIDIARNNVKRWMERCTESWEKENPDAIFGPFEDVLKWTYENLDDQRNQKKKEDNKRKKENKEKTERLCINDIIETTYIENWEKWNKSSRKSGLIKIGVDPETKKEINEFHLWRSYGVLPDFVCPGGEKRSQINNLIGSIKEYSKEKEPSYPYTSLFLSEPGWGKSYLAKQIAKLLDFEFLEYSIAQMSSSRELVDALKEISSVQKRSDKKLLVFWDEIDAHVNGYHTLSLLLGPMSDGVFKSEGYTNKIDPCIWIFAGTKTLNEIRYDMSKGRDFLSRINGQVLNIDFLTDSEREELHAKYKSEEGRNDFLKKILIGNTQPEAPSSAKDKRAEIVYYMVFALKQRFKEINKIDKKVLELFGNISPSNGIRSLNIFAAMFGNISKGEIRKCDVPKFKNNEILKRHISIIDGDKYKELVSAIDKGDKHPEMIKIKVQP